MRKPNIACWAGELIEEKVLTTTKINLVAKIIYTTRESMVATPIFVFHSGYALRVDVP